MKTYKTVRLRDAEKGCYPGIETLGTRLDHRWGLWSFVDGTPERLLGVDGGEPEDQLLVRDWKWVEVELDRAYREGMTEEHDRLVAEYEQKIAEMMHIHERT